MEIELKHGSTSIQRGRQGEGKKILMMARSKKRENRERSEYEHIEGSCYSVVDFHMVDLEHNEMSRCCFPSLIMVVSTHDILSLDEFIYIVGGLTPHKAGFLIDLPKHQSQSPKSNERYYFGGSRIDSSNKAAVWCPAPVFINDQSHCSNHVSFLGKIYSLGNDSLNPKVLDPAAVGHPKPIPLHIPEDLVDCSVSFPVLPDPCKNRILMHLHGGQLSSPSLYAFTPPDNDGIGTWTLLIRDFSVWTSSLAVVDDVIYFHSCKFPSALRAFHIAREKWLEVCWDSCYKGNVNLKDERMYFDALLPLGDNVLCFAVWDHIYPKPGTLSLDFYKFQVLQDPDGTVRLHACDSYSYELPESESVLSFISV